MSISFATRNILLEVQVRWDILADNTAYSSFNTTYYYIDQYYKILRFLLLHITPSILRITTLTNTMYYYRAQYYVILHFLILRFTTVANSLILHITTSILHQYYGQYCILLQHTILHNTASILHQYYVPILYNTTSILRQYYIILRTIRHDTTAGEKGLLLHNTTNTTDFNTT